MTINPVFNIMQWFGDNKEEMAPPVGNKMVYNDEDWIVMAVAGPNARNDYHFHERGPEWFMQVKGNMILKIMQEDGPVDIKIREGEMFMMPRSTIHSPQRPEGTWGIVLEAHAKGTERDWLYYYCDNCNNKLGQFEFKLKNIVTELPPIMAQFWDGDMKTCDKCGHVQEKPNPPKPYE
ncbi:MAG: 3-hydroxyanthranilate 3,4-dioxygenase [Candidatus Heimdallarchaeota archaeon]|nr:3-hydroxyanthranilate 3,4-dioxygenase [Candidatus Heimdallarchaeota archaeon]